MSAATNQCADLIAGAGGGVAPALRAVDCMSSEATTAAFSHLLGPQGALMPALTAVLTLYIGFFALALLTGRARLAPASLIPRLATIGLVLTFTTSWAAYEGVVWQLATGAPDQIAGIVTGDKGSATQAFASRIDTLFLTIAAASEAAGEEAAAHSAATQPLIGSPSTTAAPANPGGVPGFSPVTLLWLGATTLLLGTVGVLVTARIVLALLLALGPVFVVLALFPATRGLFVGWLRALVLAALAPLFVVLGGGFTLELAVPAVAKLVGPDGIDARGAMAFFLLAAVHAALMVMALRTAATIVGAWHVFGAAAPRREDRGGVSAALAAPAMAGTGTGAGAATPAPPGATQRGNMAYAGASPAAEAGADAGTASGRNWLPVPRPGTFAPAAAGGGRSRGAGIGSRYRSPPTARRLR
jgi:type IV secretion system protein VirB6